MRKILAIIVIAIFFTNCSQDNKQPIEEVLNRSQPTDSFDFFYEKFLSDSAFQFRHIQFPLQGVPSNATTNNDDFRWLKEDWVMHRPFDKSTSSFESTFTQISDEFIVEQIINEQATYGMERRFSKLSNGEWYLIYYAALSPL